MRRVWESSVRVEGSTGYLVISHATDGRVLTHLFDADIADQVEARRWYPAANGEYAGTVSDGHRTYYLHWLVLGLPGGHGNKTHVDHINRDPSDSRRANLRIISHRVNHYNQRRQSPLGVCIMPSAKGYFGVRMRFAEQRIYHPAFRLLADAQRCRDEYRTIADAVDAGLRPPPSKDELRAISDRIRTKIPRARKTD